jgi:hypothetical protein
MSDLDALLKNGGISVGNARWIEAKSPGDSLSVGLVALRGTDDARFCRRGEWSDWRTVDCGVAGARTLRGGDDNQRGGGEVPGGPGSRGRAAPYVESLAAST